MFWRTWYEALGVCGPRVVSASVEACLGFRVYGLAFRALMRSLPFENMCFEYRLAHG